MHRIGNNGKHFRVGFVGGPYDGIEIELVDLVPESVELAIDCVSGNGQDQRFLEILKENLGNDSSTEAIPIVTNGASIVVCYELKTDDDAMPWFSYRGWRLTGVKAAEQELK